MVAAMTQNLPQLAPPGHPGTHGRRTLEQPELASRRVLRAVRHLPNVGALSNRLTDALDIRHPIISAPMAFVGGGALAAAVSRAGGLGLIGGGYGDPEWSRRSSSGPRRTGRRRIHHLVRGPAPWRHGRCLGAQTGRRDALVRRPADLRRRHQSRGRNPHLPVPEPRPCAGALDANADIVVAQGAEAGGHGADRGTFTFVPEVADLLAHTAPDTMLLAAAEWPMGEGWRQR